MELYKNTGKKMIKDLGKKGYPKEAEETFFCRIKEIMLQAE